MKTLKTYSQLFESIGTLRNKVYEKLNLAKNDCYEDDYNSVAIQELKDILGFEFDYDMGCSFNSIELSNVDYENILDLLDIDEEQLMMLIHYNSYVYPDSEDYEEYEKHIDLIKEINNVFNIDSNEIVPFNHIIKKMYEGMFNKIGDIYEINVSEFIKKLQKELLIEVSSDTIWIYPDLIDSNLSTFEEACYENINNLDLFRIGVPELSKEEEEEKDNIVEKELNEILKYCKNNKKDILEDVCKLNSIFLPDFYKIKNYGGDFLDYVKTHDYQKKKIINNNKIQETEYNEFKLHDLLHPDIIRFKNKKEKTKRFNL